MRRVEERSRASGQSLDEAAAVVVEDLERAAVALTARTARARLWCTRGRRRGIAESRALLVRRLRVFLGLAILFAVGGFSFLTRALLVYAGRRQVGLAPTADDVAFAHDALVRKHANAHRGGWLAGIGLACLILGILFGVHISLSVG
jgi:hypothetical protein